MKSYKLKLSPLSPIHIGTGEDFEPTNYVIDKNIEGKYRLYEFSEFDFYKALDQSKKQEFNKIVAKSDYKARFELYDFIYKNRVVAKKVAFRNIQVLPKVGEEYENKIGRVVQRGGGGKNVFNEFKIAKTYTLPNSHKPIILGSSLKGSISTAYQEFLYKKLRDYGKVENLMLRPTEQNLFRNIIVSDAEALKHGTFVGYAVNIKRNKETKNEMKTRLEAITGSSKFETTIVCKDWIEGKDKIKTMDFAEIAKSCNDHYFPIFKSQFDYHTDEYVRKSLSDSFMKHESWKPKENQFLLKVGKHSGARAVTVEGIRNIKIMQGKGRSPKFSNEESTAWLRGGIGEGLQPFGWLLCEIVG